MQEIVVSAQLPPSVLKELSPTERKQRLSLMAEELFGSDWRYKLAKMLKVSARTVRRWFEEDAVIPPVVLVATGAVLEVDRRIARQEHYG